MYLDAALSFLHFAFIFILVGALSAEAFVLRLKIDAAAARLLLRIDLFYAIAAAGLILAGLARVFWGAKGVAYYAGQPTFWAKMAVFALIGLASIMPTRFYFRCVRAARADPAFVADESQVRAARRFVTGEVHALALLILLAVLMARGIG